MPFLGGSCNKGTGRVVTGYIELRLADVDVPTALSGRSASNERPSSACCAPEGKFLKLTYLLCVFL